MPEETDEERDKRIKKLWTTLNVTKGRHLDAASFKKGLRRIDHPLKNADELLHEILKAVDSSGNGKIQYNEFRVFLEHAERELYQLFESIDKDRNGALDKDELRQAFARSGVVVSSAKLDQFFDEIDVNHDGKISFEEWRFVRVIRCMRYVRADHDQGLSPVPTEYIA